MNKKKEIVLRDYTTYKLGLLKKKKTDYKNGTKKGRECEGGLVVNGGKWNYYGRGKHTLHLIYKRNLLFSFSFSFSFSI